MDVYDSRILYQQMYKIVGAAMNLYNELGNGYSEAIYQECMAIVCTEKGIPWEREKLLKMHFHGQTLHKQYFADFVCYDNIIVELKAVDEVISEHRAQLLNYLRIAKAPAGVLINFGNPKLLFSEKYLFAPSSNCYYFVRNQNDIVNDHYSM